jgi:hypothetical protein
MRLALVANGTDGISCIPAALRASSDQMESSDQIKMLDSKVLEQFYPSVWMDIALGQITPRRKTARFLHRSIANDTNAEPR